MKPAQCPDVSTNYAVHIPSERKRAVLTIWNLGIYLFLLSNSRRFAPHMCPLMRPASRLSAWIFLVGARCFMHALDQEFRVKETVGNVIHVVSEFNATTIASSKTPLPLRRYLTNESCRADSYVHGHNSVGLVPAIPQRVIHVEKFARSNLCDAGVSRARTVPDRGLVGPRRASIGAE